MKRIKKSIFKNPILFGLLIAILATFCDLATKNFIFEILGKIAQEQQSNNPQIKIFDFFSIVYVVNKGVSFGMFNNFENSNLIFSIVQGSISMVVLFLIIKSKSFLSTTGMALIFGGAMGNVIDRIQHEGVMDFLDFHIANYHWPAFNLADSFVFIGVVILIFIEFFLKPLR